LADGGYDQEADRLTLRTAKGDYHIAWASTVETTCDIARGDPNSPRGWRSPYYQHRLPAVSLAVNVEAAELVLATVFGPGTCTLKVENDAVHVEASRWSLCAGLSPDPQSPMLTTLEISESAAVAV
jgi:hypothetical protein